MSDLVRDSSWLAREQIHQAPVLQRPALEVEKRRGTLSFATKILRLMRIPHRSRCLLIAGAFAFAVSTAFCQDNPVPEPQSTASKSVPAWQSAAGGKRSFDVASIRLGDPDKFMPPNIALNTDDEPIAPGGRFFADFPLEVYIEFAYKIMPNQDQRKAMIAHLPPWVAKDSFVIQASAEGNPTKDQMRLMIQSLLADRFKLAVHFETQATPVLALELKKAGALGPRIRRHSDGPPCEKTLAPSADPGSPLLPPGGFMTVCGLVQAVSGPNHTAVLGARNVTMKQIADYLGTFGILERPVVDETGLDGTYDFSLSFLPQRKSPPPQDGGGQPEADGPSLLEAIQEQFAMKLKPTQEPLKVLVVDHVERPSEN